MHMNVCVEVRDQHRYLPKSLSTVFFEAGSLTEPGAQLFMDAGWTVSCRDPFVSVSTIPLHGGLVTDVSRFYRTAEDASSGPRSCTSSMVVVFDRIIFLAHFSRFLCGREATF